MAKRYDITPVAESLLADQRSRRRDEDNDKNIWKSLAVSLGVGIGNRLLEKRANEFNSNAQIMAAKAKNQTDYEDKLRIKQTRDTIAASNKGTATYFADLMYNDMLAAEMKRQEGHKLTQSGKDALALSVRSRAGELGAERARLFEESEKAAESVISPEDFEKRIVLANSRPRNVVDWLADKITFKDQKEADAVAIEGLRRSGEYPGEQMDFFINAFDQSGNWSDAAELTDAVFEKKDKDKVVKTMVQQMQDGTLMAITTSQAVNADGQPEGNPTVSKQSLGNYGKGSDPQAEAVRDINKFGRFLDQAAKHLTPEARADLTAELSKQGIVATNFKSPDEVSIAFNLLGDYHNNVNNLKDEFKENVYLELIKENISKVSTIDIALMMAETDPQKKGAMWSQWVQSVINMNVETKEGIERIDNTRQRSYSDLPKL